MAVLRLKEWKIEVYDSMAKPGRHNKEVIEALQGMTTIIPKLAGNLELFLNRSSDQTIPVIIMESEKQENGLKMGE